MKPALEKLPRKPTESFVVMDFNYRYYPTPWHFHPEYELVLVTESTGKRFVGNEMTDFKPGDLALLGPNLPHLYRNDDIYYNPKSKLRARSIVVHFLPEAFGERFFDLPESASIGKLLSKSSRGIEIVGKTNKVISQKLHELVNDKGLRRWIKLLDILQLISETRDYRFISSIAQRGQNETESRRMSRIFDFVLANYHRDITVREMADLTNMATNSFSRFFSKRTRKTFTSFLNEVRLNEAARRIVENEKNVAEISFDCGFNNLSNFNRQFRRHFGNSPLVFRNSFLVNT